MVLVGMPGSGRTSFVRAGIIPAVQAFCERRGEDVWLRRGGALKVSTTASQDAKIDAAVEAARALGAPERAVPLTHEEVAARCPDPAGDVEQGRVGVPGGHCPWN